MKQYNTDLDFQFPLGGLTVNVLAVNYEAPIPGWGYGLHSHSTWELHFIAQGRGELRVGRELYPIVPGTFYLTGPGVFHEQKADRLDPMNEFCLNFDLVRPPVLGREEASLVQVLDDQPFWFGTDDQGSISLFEKVFIELETRRIGAYFAIQDLLSLIVLQTVRSLAPRQTSRSDLPGKDLHSARRFWIDRYFDLDEPHSREGLADVIGTSVRQLNRILKDFYGMSFTEKLTDTRLQKAAFLLETTDLSVQVIAEKLEFSSQAYLCTQFRKKYGHTPSKHRKEGDFFSLLGHEPPRMSQGRVSASKPLR